MANAVDKGNWAENLAYEYLKLQGLKYVTKNYLCRMGEIDLIMRQKEILVFVEVRFRSNRSYASPSQSISVTKQRKLIRTAQHYLKRYGLIGAAICRFDVVGIELVENSQPNIEWIKNAFQVEW